MKIRSFNAHFVGHFGCIFGRHIDIAVMLYCQNGKRRFIYLTTYDQQQQSSWYIILIFLRVYFDTLAAILDAILKSLILRFIEITAGVYFFSNHVSFHPLPHPLNAKTVTICHLEQVYIYCCVLAAILDAILYKVTTLIY